ncbi:MAG: caspase family protein [Thermoleophilia bacterium]|jgi:hypothetical protein
MNAVLDSPSPSAQNTVPVALPDPSLRSVPNHKKFAVVIGVVYDSNDFGYVGFADRDAGSVYDMLTGKMGFPPENVILLQNSQATLDNIFKSLEWLTTNPQIDSESEVVFFYSGHGLRNGPGAGLNIPDLAPGAALVPFDYPGFDFKRGQGLIWDSQLAEFLSRISPARMWINIDSCSAGGFNRPGISGPNRIVTMSSQVDELSSEISDAGRGVMTQYLVEDGILKGLSIEDAYLAAVPRAALGYGQNPQIADEYPGNLNL